MNGVRRFLSGGLVGSSSQSDPAPPIPAGGPVAPLIISEKPSWPPSTPPLQAAGPTIAQDLSESPISSPITTAGLVLRRDKQRPPLPPPPPPDDDPSDSPTQSSRPSSAATSFTTSPLRSQFYAQASPSSRVQPQRAIRVSRKSVDTYDTNSGRAPGLLNTRDELLMSLLASQAVVDSRGFEILSSEQVEDLKKEHQVLSSRLVAMTQKLTLETKIRDAALSLTKVNSPYKSVSKQTSEQLDAANRKVEIVQKELWKVSERANDIYRKLLEHRAGVLSFSVRSLEKKNMADHGTPSFSSVGLPSGTSTPMSGNGSTSSPVTSPTRKFEHFFAGHAESIIPQTPKKPLSIAEVAALEEQLQAVTQNLNAANKKQAETARDLSLLKLEKDQVETSMEMELQTAEETIHALEKEISNLEDLDAQVRALQEEKRIWEDERAELEARRQEVETLERRLEVLEERSGEFTEMVRILEQKDEEISHLKEQWERDKSSLEEGAAAQLDKSFAALWTLIQKHDIMLTSQHSGSSLSGLVESIASHMEDVNETRTRLEEEVRRCVDKKESLVQALEEARMVQEGSRKEISYLGAQVKEQSDRIAEIVALQPSTSVAPVEYTGDAGKIVAALMPIWTILSSAEARGAKLGQSRFRSPTSGAGVGGPLKPSLSEMDVRSLKFLYDASKPGQSQSTSSGFTIEVFVTRVQALINDDRALIERLLRFAQAHDLLKRNAERAQKLALESNVALETYQKQVKTLEDRDMMVSARHAALLEEVQNLQDALERVESEKRDLEMQAAEQAETCRQLTDANNALSAKTLGLAEEAASATDTVRRQMEAQLTECRVSLQTARDEIEAMQNSEQTQRVALLEELNTMQTENSNLRAQLRNAQGKK